jgi:lipid II:glycine glycyltransferase (peptidoglycan interpeptide bridge formation enzyme)
VWWRRWQAPTVKAALAAAVEDQADGATGTPRSFADLPPDATNPTASALVAALDSAGWRPEGGQDGFGDGQPDHVFQLPLAGQTRESLLAGFNQLWRRNIRKADKAGVAVELGQADDLADFHRIYLETATRDGFTPRPLPYFTTMWRAMRAEAPERLALYLARHEGELVAATLMARVGGHAWYSYGASTGARREVRGSNAIQWRMITDALEAGAAVYDMRGITATLDPTDPQVGLVQFKLGTGGRVQQYPGEWTYPIRPAVHKAFTAFMAHRR